jgi:hypothetical protein
MWKRNRRRALVALAIVIYFAVTRYYPLTVLNPFWLVYFHWSHDAALRNGVSEIEPIKQFAEMYPEAEHTISHFSAGDGSESWTSTVGLHGRYVFTVQVDVRLNWSLRHVASFGTAKYVLNEIESVGLGTSGQASITTKDSWHFGPDRWEAVYHARGDLRALGIDVITDRPIPHFDGARP